MLAEPARIYNMYVPLFTKWRFCKLTLTFVQLYLRIYFVRRLAEFMFLSTIQSVYSCLSICILSFPTDRKEYFPIKSERILYNGKLEM